MFAEYVRSAGLCTLVFLAACAGPRTPSPEISEVDAAAEAAKQKELYVRRLLGDEARLWDVGYPLLLEGAPLCGDVVEASVGLRALAQQDLSGEYADIAAKLLKLTDRPSVIQVLPGSPAEAAGLRQGDVLLEIGSKAVPSGRDAELLARMLDDAMVVGEPVTLKVRRGSESLYISPSAREACDYGLALGQEDHINAYADGSSVTVTRGMMRFAESDQHLAVVIGHELAHNTMEHIDAKELNSMAAGAGGFILDLGLAVLGVNTGGAFAKAASRAGAAAYSVAFEQEADYIGLYFLARAGHELEGAADLWRLMAVENPNSIERSSSHPTTPARFLALEQAIEEIESKRQDGAPLLPEVLPDPAARPEGNRFLESAYPE